MAHQSHGDSRSLYHRWRSRSFSEVVAQEHVTRTLRNAIAGGRMVHAYLFCGPRGTGKTSTARILAKAANCLDPQQGEPCNQCHSCVAVSEGRAIDLIEIDAASNRGIDDARELREKIKFSPSESRYKVYIIDEAHMLTSEASNALLKTLEEPPEHAILILATTEAHKILPTISSRCQRFDFRRIPLSAIVEQLAMICGQEGLEVEVGVLDRVARLARGSLRDAESLLDQLVAYCGVRIDLAAARNALGLAGEESVPEFAEAVRRGDLAGGFILIDSAASGGADLRHLSRELTDHLRALMVVKSGADTSLTREFRPEELERLRSTAANWEYRRLLAAVHAFGDLEGRMRLEPFNQLHLETALMEVSIGTVGVRGDVIPSSGEGATGSAVAEPRPEVAYAVREGGVARSGPPTAAAGSPSAGPSAAAAPFAGAPRLDQEVSPGGATPALPQGVPTKGAATAEDEQRDTAEVGPPDTSVAVPPLNLAGVRRAWPRVVRDLGETGGPAIAVILPGCEPLEVDGHTIVFAFERAGWRDKVERLDVRARLEQSLSDLFGTRIGVQFRYGVKITREAEALSRDAVVDAAVRDLGFKIRGVEPIS